MGYKRKRRYQFKADTFARDLDSWLEEKEFEPTSFADAIDLGRSAVLRVLKKKGVRAEVMAVICAYTNLDIRHYVLETFDRDAQMGLELIKPEEAATLPARGK